VAGGWTKLKVKSFATCTPHQIFLGWSNQGGWNWWGI